MIISFLLALLVFEKFGFIFSVFFLHFKQEDDICLYYLRILSNNFINAFSQFYYAFSFYFVSFLAIFLQCL